MYYGKKCPLSQLFQAHYKPEGGVKILKKMKYDDLCQENVREGR
jgi:hypothetical protein